MHQQLVIVYRIDAQPPQPTTEAELQQYLTQMAIADFK